MSSRKKTNSSIKKWLRTSMEKSIERRKNFISSESDKNCGSSDVHQFEKRCFSEIKFEVLD